MSTISNQLEHPVHLNHNRALVSCVTVVIWLTVFATFSLPGRQTQPTAEALDTVALVKLASRLASLGLLGWVLFSHFRNNRLQRLTIAYWPWILFAGWATLSTVWSPLRSVTLGQAAGQVSLIFLSLTVAMSTRIGGRKYLHHCLMALFLYCGIYGCGVYLLPGMFDVVRGSGRNLVHPTALGASASLGLVLVTGLLLSQPQQWLRSMALLMVPVFVVALMTAHNRLSVALAISICLPMILVRGQSFRLAAAAVVFAVLGMGYMLVDPGLTAIESMMGSSIDFMQRGQSSEQLGQLSGRSEMWAKMWSSFLESPVIGHGHFVCSSTGVLYVWFHEQNHTAHNLTLQSLVSTGLIGASLFAIWHLQILRFLIGNLWNAASCSPISLLAPAVVIWFLVWTQLNVSYLGPVRPESAVFAIIVGLIVGVRFPESQLGEPQEQNRSGGIQ